MKNPYLFEEKNDQSRREWTQVYLEEMPWNSFVCIVNKMKENKQDCKIQWLHSLII